MSERRDGWYWVEIDASSGWECSYWNGKEWDGIEPMVIGPRIPTPDEPWKTVPVEPTKVMREEFHEANEACEEGADGGIGSPDFQWKAMLAAAPSPGEDQ